ncbi:MAG: hypothetical protein ACRDPY_03350 [Streptosporangiaceae bacterium]
MAFWVINAIAQMDAASAVPTAITVGPVYGERQYGVLDLDGHHWLSAAHARDVSPAEWGATVTSDVRMRG